MSLVTQPLSVAIYGYPRASLVAIPWTAGNIAVLAIPLLWIPTVAPSSCHSPETWPVIDGENLFAVFSGNQTLAGYAIHGCLHLRRVQDWSISLM